MNVCYLHRYIGTYMYICVMQAGVAFELAPWKNTGGCILKGASVDEAQLQLDDHALKSQAMMSSPFAKPFMTASQCGRHASARCRQSLMNG